MILLKLLLVIITKLGPLFLGAHIEFAGNVAAIFRVEEVADVEVFEGLGGRQIAHPDGKK